MHNTGFNHYQLPFVYELCDTTELTEVVKSLQEPTTFGGSVTIPHKQTIIPYIDCLSPSARAIGAVNTVNKLIDGTLYGDNTDWIAIYKLIKHNIKEKDVSSLHGLLFFFVCQNNIE